MHLLKSFTRSHNFERSKTTKKDTICHREQLLHISLCSTLGCSGDSMPIKQSFCWTCRVYLLQHKHCSQTSSRSLRMHWIAMYACSCTHIPITCRSTKQVVCATDHYLREGQQARTHVLKRVAHLHASAWHSSANPQDAGKADRQHTLCNWCFELEQHLLDVLDLHTMWIMSAFVYVLSDVRVCITF